MQHSRSPREYLEDRFGIDPGALEAYQLHERGGDIWMTSQEADTERGSVATGIRLLRSTGMTHSPFKPTTYGLQVLADHVTGSIVDLSRDELEAVVFDRERIDCDAPDGYVALRFRGSIIGCGMVTRKGLETQVPKGRAQDLEGMLGTGRD